MTSHHMHVEAFCLMPYANKAGQVVWVWNSRDGVTPFIFKHHACEWEHVMGRDIYAPHHAPKAGDLIFVTLTLERAREHRAVYVTRHWNHLQDNVFFAAMPYEQAVDYLAKSDVEEFGGGSPDLVEVTPEMAAEFAQWGVDRHPERRPA